MPAPASTIAERPRNEPISTTRPAGATAAAAVVQAPRLRLGQPALDVARVRPGVGERHASDIRRRRRAVRPMTRIEPAATT